MEGSSDSSATKTTVLYWFCLSCRHRQHSWVFSEGIDRIHKNIWVSGWYIIHWSGIKCEWQESDCFKIWKLESSKLLPFASWCNVTSPRRYEPKCRLSRNPYCYECEYLQQSKDRAHASQRKLVIVTLPANANSQDETDERALNADSIILHRWYWTVEMSSCIQTHLHTRAEQS